MNMNEMISRYRFDSLVAYFTIMMFVYTTNSLADVRGTIIQKDGGKVSGDLRWQPASKVYALTRGNITTKIPLSRVASVQVKRPAELNGAARKVRTRQYSAAIPVLEKIVKIYAMLQWDIEATRWLAEAYLKTDDPQKCVAVCEKAMNGKFASLVPDEMDNIYSAALLETEQYAKLKKILKRMIEQGGREQAAAAQVMRGNIDMKKGNFRDALLNGYLRTIVLFDHVKQVQPEALFKAVRCFEELGKTSHAEKMRKKLLAGFPKSSYAKKIRSGW